MCDFAHELPAWPRKSVASPRFGYHRCLLWVDTVEKLRITMTRKFIGIFRLPGAQISDQLCRSELRQAEFSYDFCYPLVPTVRNAAQIANKIVALFKTEFFNRIGH